MKIIQISTRGGGLVALTDSGEIWERIFSLPVSGCSKGDAIGGEPVYWWKKIELPDLRE
jgi:hypothetical protein